MIAACPLCRRAPERLDATDGLPSLNVDSVAKTGMAPMGGDP
jgi:hypothetical protein